MKCRPNSAKPASTSGVKRLASSLGPSAPSPKVVSKKPAPSTSFYKASTTSGPAASAAGAGRHSQATLRTQARDQLQSALLFVWEQVKGTEGDSNLTDKATEAAHQLEASLWLKVVQNPRPDVSVQSTPSALKPSNMGTKIKQRGAGLAGSASSMSALRQEKAKVAKYRDRLRILLVQLKNKRNTSLHKQIATGSISPEQLAELTPEQLASESMRTLIASTRKEKLASSVVQAPSVESEPETREVEYQPITVRSSAPSPSPPSPVRKTSTTERLPGKGASLSHDGVKPAPTKPPMATSAALPANRPKSSVNLDGLLSAVHAPSLPKAENNMTRSSSSPTPSQQAASLAPSRKGSEKEQDPTLTDPAPLSPGSVEMADAAQLSQNGQDAPHTVSNSPEAEPPTRPDIAELLRQLKASIVSLLPPEDRDQEPAIQQAPPNPKTPEATKAQASPEEATDRQDTTRTKAESDRSLSPENPDPSADAPQKAPSSTESHASIDKEKHHNSPTSTSTTQVENRSDRHTSHDSPPEMHTPASLGPNIEGAAHPASEALASGSALQNLLRSIQEHSNTPTGTRPPAGIAPKPPSPPPSSEATSTTIDQLLRRLV